MTFRFLAGVALVAAGAAYLAKRYRKRLEIAEEVEATPKLDDAAPASSKAARVRGEDGADPGEAVYVG